MDKQMQTKDKTFKLYFYLNLQTGNSLYPKRGIRDFRGKRLGAIQKAYDTVK